MVDFKLLISFHITEIEYVSGKIVKTPEKLHILKKQS